MRNLLFLYLPIVIFLSFSCEKEKDCPNAPAECSENPPSDELCEAYFMRWFYNEETNSCEQIGYSGCNVYGFETKAECEECDCD